jgi:hypothetical protein
VATLAADAADVTRSESFAALAARLTVRAEDIAQAHGESLILERHDDHRRWRRARLLWPNFSKG